MSEWRIYGPDDFLLFTRQSYYRMLELYNEAVWPLQVLASALGITIAVLVFRKPAWQGRAITTILSAAWLWVGWAYHLRHYAVINWAAVWFSAGFGVQALLLLWTGLFRDRLEYDAPTPVLGWAGAGIFGFALFIYPLLGPILNRPWAQAEVFGIAPDPTAIATLGLLLLATQRTVWTLLLIPVLWCTVSAAFLWMMGSPEAFIPLLAALVTIVFSGGKRIVEE